MSDHDVLDGLFAELATAELPVPARSGVVARGRQRRRHGRILAATATLAAAAVIGSAVAYIQRVTPRVPSPQASSTSKPSPTPAATLPPAGTGTLMLGFEGHGFAMARAGSTAAPVKLPGLLAGPAAVVDLESLIAVNPAGGWVISYATSNKSDFGSVPTRLATVSPAGVVTPFGQGFGGPLLPTGLAVQPGGSAVAVGLENTNGDSVILLVPLPGHRGTVRKWLLLPSPGEVSRPHPISMSFDRNGTELTYFVGHPTGGGVSTSGAVTLNVTSSHPLAPTVPDWPPLTKPRPPGSCHGVAGAWDGSRYVALEQCDTNYQLRAVNPGTGSLDGSSVVVPVPWGCAASEVFPATRTGQVLISACGTFLVTGGHATTLRGLPAGAVWAGGQ